MNRISQVFKNNKAFIAFITAGDPCLEKTADFIKTMDKAGADIIEMGIPFSDPVAEGEVIQKASLRALNAGTTPKKIFEMVEGLKGQIKAVLVFMTYINPVYNYGYDAFFARCAELGIAGIIVPDMPFEERDEILEIAKKHGVSVISLIAPTSKDRIKTIARGSEGFIYCVSSMGVTGVRTEITTDLESIIKLIKSETETPAAVGFGISTPDQAKKISRYADGVIVGSAIVRIIEKYGKDADSYVYDYVKSMKDAVMS